MTKLSCKGDLKTLTDTASVDKFNLDLKKTEEVRLNLNIPASLIMCCNALHRSTCRTAANAQMQPSPERYVQLYCDYLLLLRVSNNLTHHEDVRILLSK